MARMSALILHLPADWLADPSRMLPFYARLSEGLTARGIDWQARAIDRDGLAARIAADGDFHIVNHGQIRHARALNAGIAYVYPFWNLDPEGIRAHSSIARQPFRPARIDAARAQRFFARLRARLVDARQSRYEQPEAPADLPEAEAAVFFQSEAHRTVGETCYMDRWQMLDAVLAATRGPVIVKPHPRDLDAGLWDRLMQMRDQTPRLVVSGANIHDILARAARVVTINSAVGIEAYLHRKPVILCGHADFHHIAITARDPEALVAALRAPPPARAYAKYIHWYFAQCCINAGSKTLVEDVLERVRRTGFAI